VPVAFATQAAASQWGRETGEEEKVGMGLTAGPTWRLLTVYFGAPSMFITLWFGFDY
jgi:hypothetical protein